MSTGTSPTPTPAATSTPPPQQEKLFVLRSWLVQGGPDTKDNVADLTQEITNGWFVRCYETVLQDTNHGICYVLVKLYKPNP
jgi:hypothetical protein